MNPDLCLRLTEVRLSFGALAAIDGVSLEIPTGERHALLGTNGAGKTTMFNVITGDLLASSGKVEFFGRDISALPPYERCKLGVGRTYQTPLLFTDLTVLDNVLVATRGKELGGLSVRRIDRQSEWYRFAVATCEYVGIAGLASTKISKLSHGQKKQLELGMALASKPRLLLLDEPAAGLSPDDRKSFVARIAALPADLTILFVEHDMEVALKLAHRVTVMKDGRFLASGTPDEIRANPEVLRLYLGSPIEVAA